MYAADGEAEITIAGKEIVVKKGEIVILPAGKSHAVKTVSQFKMLLVIIKS